MKYYSVSDKTIKWSSAKRMVRNCFKWHEAIHMYLTEIAMPVYSQGALDSKKQSDNVYCFQ